MYTFSNVTVVGRITRDAEMRMTAGENSNVIVRFSIVVDRRRRDGDSFIEEPNFFNVSFFGMRAQSVCSFLSKGSLVGVVGELVQRKYTDKDGRDCQIVEILANNVHLIETKGMKEQRLAEGSSFQSYGSASYANNQSYNSNSNYAQRTSFNQNPNFASSMNQSSFNQGYNSQGNNNQNYTSQSYPSSNPGSNYSKPSSISSSSSDSNKNEQDSGISRFAPEKTATPDDFTEDDNIPF